MAEINNTKEGNQLRQVREALHMKQKDFATALGITQSYLSAVELGKKEITTKLSKKLIELFQVSPDWMLRNEGSIFRTGFDPLNSVDLTLQNEKTTTFLSKNSQNNSYIGRGSKAVYDLESLQNQYDKARSDIEQREWQRIDTRLHGVVSNLLHIQEVTEDVLGVPFDNEAYVALRRESAQPRIQRTEDGRYVNPLNEMEYEEKSRFYATRAQLLEQCEAELSDTIRSLNIALSTSNQSLFSNTPFKGSVAEFLISSDFLAKRRRARYGHLK